MPIPQGAVLKIETLDVGFKAFAVREKPGVVSSLSFVYRYPGGGVLVRACPSLPCLDVSTSHSPNV